MWRLVSSLVKALKVPSPALGWDSANGMDINQLLALVEDVICPQNMAGQVSLGQACGFSKKLAFHHQNHPQEGPCLHFIDEKTSSPRCLSPRVTRGDSCARLLLLGSLVPWLLLPKVAWTTPQPLSSRLGSRRGGRRPGAHALSQSPRSFWRERHPLAAGELGKRS